ncbi:DUF6192 family protein [Streptomyces chrestomyceticus]|uniref:DUF6192 family protein n=1 Tax=Streptomyces chrestomyceticus TaxID=68185 RepID=UPI0037A9A720
MREFSESQLALVARNLEKIRATADWIETAVATGQVDLDEALAELLGQAMPRRAGQPAHVHAEAVRKALEEARPAGVSLKQLMRTTKRSRAQVGVGIRYLRKFAIRDGLPPVTYSRKDGFQLSEDPEVWIAYERAVRKIELRRITNFIAAAVGPHAIKLPKDEWARPVLDQLGGVKATLEVLTRLER